ncbi:MAG: DUF1549 and DUF1553 domain-containing protein [Planctomycetia bacterium]|nr:DUF1549 and DUF1553 domain-containing protein [Planctomycetia bacterium]
MIFRIDRLWNLRFYCSFVAILASSTCSQADSHVSVSFNTDVVPLLTKLGCNGGGCHGKATGQNGFKLSLLGFEPDLDYDAIVREARGRRWFPGSASRSLLLLKATGISPHGGGVRLNQDSEDYRTLLTWLEQGAQPSRSHEPTLERISVSPTTHVFDAKREPQPLRVTAAFSDGSTRDVTSRAVYQSNEPELAEVSEAGVVQTSKRGGSFAVMVRFCEQIAVFHGTVPLTESTAETSAQLAAWDRNVARSFVDRHLAAQWKRLGIVPSEPADDREFIRRVSIDICGTLPTPAELAEYVSDARSDKRARLVDRLLERPQYASNFALKWADILRNRGAGYSTRYQRLGTTLFSGWIRDSFAANVPYDRFVASIVTASGSQEANPPAIWYRTVRTNSDYVESVAQAFLGIRIQCAQCHHHPAERWSQADYYQLAAVFARVGRKGGYADAEVPTDETIYLADEGEVFHPRTGKRMTPRPPGGAEFTLDRFDDPRQSLADWMASPENPYVARTMVNRMWGHFFNRGIIHPIDDARSTNPPSNPELIDALAHDFIAHKYDIKHLIRTICNSAAYGISSVPNGTNRDDAQNYARYYPRRMQAEVLLDALSQVLDAPTKFRAAGGEFPAGTRAIDLPDEAVPNHFLDVFGRPARNSACECERVDSPALGQTLELVNSAELQTKLTTEKGYVAQLAANSRPNAENVEEVFIRVLARPPRDKERATALKFLESQKDRKTAYASLLWSLIATNEFLFNH